MSFSSKQEVDTKYLHGRFDKAEDQRARFARRVAHKAVNLPLDDEMYIEANKTGLSTGGALGVAAAAGIPSVVAAAILGYVLMNKESPATQQPAATAPLEDRDYEIRFFDKDGNLINVPRFTPPAAKE